jgi:hypothetical protein
MLAPACTPLLARINAQPLRYESREAMLEERGMADLLGARLAMAQHQLDGSLLVELTDRGITYCERNTSRGKLTAPQPQLF